VGRTILVADDSPTVQKKASGILTGEGLDVVTVSNGVAAVKKLPTVNPLVVLADVSMPGKDGYEVCEHIKSNASLSHVPVILIFSDTDPYEEAKGTRVSADGRIRKPFDRDELVSTVAKFVAQAEAAVQQKAAPAPSAPPASFEVEPMDAEPEAAVRSQGPDFSAFTGGVAFGVPGTEEVPAIPPESMVSEPVTMPAEAPPSEDESLVSPDHALDAIAESAPAVSEPPPALVTEPETDLAAEPQVEAVAPEPASEAAEPVLVEDEPAPPPTPEQAAEHTLMFRAPADIAQPVFSDEVETSPPGAETVEAPAAETPPVAETAAEPAPPPVAEVAPVEAPAEVRFADVTPPEGTPVATKTLESYTLNDAAAGQVRFAPSDAEAPPEMEPEAAAPQPGMAAPPPEPVAPAMEAAPPPSEIAAPAPAASSTFDPEELFLIVHKVVVKMSPPALSPQMIEDIARRFADEIAAELRSES
jgi:CheY-like chemotaxis protein